MDETYMLVAGQWKYLYRAVDRNGDRIDFLLRAKTFLRHVVNNQSLVPVNQSPSSSRSLFVKKSLIAAVVALAASGAVFAVVTTDSAGVTTNTDPAKAASVEQHAKELGSRTPEAFHRGNKKASMHHMHRMHQMHHKHHKHTGA